VSEFAQYSASWPPQLAMLERQVGRPRWQPTDRLVLAALSRVLPRTDWRSLLPRPETLLRWHRELVRRKWAAYGRRPRRRQLNCRNELHDLILKLAAENGGWGTGGSLASCASRVTAAQTSPCARCCGTMAWSRHRAAASALGGSSCVSTPTRSSPRISSA
jgi:hypothetical protein